MVYRSTLRDKLRTDFYGDILTPAQAIGTAIETSLTGPPGPQGPAGPAGSDATVTKAAVEAVLTGTISSHSHAGGAHVQGTDQHLDFGGVSQVSAAEAKAGYTHSGTAHAPSGATVGATWSVNITGQPSTFPPSTHSHAPSDVTGTAVITSDSRLSDSRPASDVYTWAKAATKPSYNYSEVGAEQSGAVSTHASLSTGVHGSGANSLVYSNDSRLSDSRTPTSHTIEGHTATVSSGQFLKGTGVNTFGWAAHGLTYSSVGAEPAKGLDDNYVTDAEKIVIGNTSGTNTGDNATNSQYSGLAASKQDTLVSGTNIKTINSTSILGSGDIAVGGGSTPTSWGKYF